MDGYDERDLKVTFLNKNEILVEGTKSDPSQPGAKFSRKFPLPENMDFSSVTSSLSTDYILLISIIKQVLSL